MVQVKARCIYWDVWIVSSGRYLLNGQDVSQMDDRQLNSVRLSHIGFIFQSFHLMQLTVRQNIQLPLGYLG